MSADLNIMEDMMMINNETRRKLEEMNLSEFIQALDRSKQKPCTTSGQENRTAVPARLWTWRRRYSLRTD